LTQVYLDLWAQAATVGPGTYSFTTLTFESYEGLKTMSQFILFIFIIDSLNRLLHKLTKLKLTLHNKATHILSYLHTIITQQ
ncbi:hypothetical protein ACJX0J_019709, partial [Zea mays]